MSKVEKFYEIKNHLQCPICGKKIRFHNNGFVCKKEHRFDISSKGYVNFIQSTKELKGYDGEFFESRRRFFADGFYDHIAEIVLDAAIEVEGKTILDAGCGEGFYALGLAEKTTAQILAFDLATDAIKIAARGDNQIKWMVADITNIPVKDGEIDCILDIFTTASYTEFTRVLSEKGIIIKVIPGVMHLKELRSAAGNLIRSKEYDNQEVIDYFCQNYQLLDRIPVTRTMAISQPQLEDLIRMTPLLFDVDKTKLDVRGLDEITIEGEILIGKPLSFVQKKRGKEPTDGAK